MHQEDLDHTIYLPVVWTSVSVMLTVKPYPFDTTHTSTAPADSTTLYNTTSKPTDAFENMMSLMMENQGRPLSISRQYNQITTSIEEWEKQNMRLQQQHKLEREVEYKNLERYQKLRVLALRPAVSPLRPQSVSLLSPLNKVMTSDREGEHLEKNVTLSQNQVFNIAILECASSTT